MRVGTKAVQGTGRAGAKARAHQLGLRRAACFPSRQAGLGSFLALVLPARGRPAEKSPHQLSFAFAFSKGADVERVCGDQQRPQLDGGEAEALVPGPPPRHAALPAFARDSEVLAWPAQGGNFRGEFVYFKPHPGSWVGFLCDDFVFCI